ncbi:hypothetical protein GQ42DRAFT_141656 [Ramicandelaber brevisporus]|nr:hypothetical protein GQ42DRAFT_141656 [Ramicandelaber brevisporus]
MTEQPSSNTSADAQLASGVNQLNLRAAAPAFIPRASAQAFVPRARQQPAASAPTAPASSPAPTSAPVPAPAPAPAKPAAAAAAAATPASSTSATPSIRPSPSPAATAEVDREEQILLDEHYKEHFNLVFIGHVDAGKSTLGGNILYLTGMVDKRTLEKYEREAKEAGRESWYLSWALDTSNEERAKGKTVEAGRAFFETDKRRYTILDAPGHKSFVPNMIGAATQADIGVLVISARRGEFETGFDRGGQTREHAMLAKTNGVNRLIVVINKMDDPTVNWSKERYDEIIASLHPFLKKSGYPGKSDLVFLPISGFSGANVKDPVGKDVCPWWDGQTLLGTLDTMQAVNRKINAPLRLPLTGKYKEMGTMLLGKIESGHVKKGQAILIMPNQRKCEVLGVYIEEDEVPMAVCGDNVRLKVKGVDEEDVQVGFVISDVNSPIKAVSQIDVQLRVLDIDNIISAGFTAVMHLHTAVEEVTLTQMICGVDSKTGKRVKKAPGFLTKNHQAVVRFEITQQVAVDTYKTFPNLGRFTLRDKGKTIGIGKVLKLIDGSA